MPQKKKANTANYWVLSEELFYNLLTQSFRAKSFRASSAVSPCMPRIGLPLPSFLCRDPRGNLGVGRLSRTAGSCSMGNWNDMNGGASLGKRASSKVHFAIKKQQCRGRRAMIAHPGGVPGHIHDPSCFATRLSPVCKLTGSIEVLLGFGTATRRPPATQSQ
jgi:hypothetical protein